MNRKISIGVICSLFLLLATAPAVAHSSIVSTTPEYKSTLTDMPSAIEIEFTEELMTIGEKSINSIEVTGPEGGEVAISKTEVNKSLLTATLAPQEFADGTYIVSYRVVSADGHGVSGSYEIYLNAPTTITNTATSEVEHKSFFHQHQIHFLWSGLALIIILLWVIYRRFERNQS